MYDDIKMSPIKNHLRDMKTMFIIVVLISIFIPVLMGMSIQMNKTYGHALAFKTKKILKKN